MQAGFALLAGLLFGVGLIVSGMANPQKVLGFLAGGPLGSVARVRDGRCNRRGRVRVRLGEAPDADVARLADAVAGRAGDHRAAGCRKCRVRYRLGIAGFCPGAIVSIGFGSAKGIVFVVAMLAGMAVFEWVERRRSVR